MSKKLIRTNFASICRTCMSTKSLNPIFDGKRCERYYSSIIFLVSGVRVQKDDGLPQKLCTNCIRVIHNILEFRKRSQNVAVMLLQTRPFRITERNGPDTNIIVINPADDESDDDPLIKYVNTDRQHKNQSKFNEFENITTHNKNCFIKTEAKTNNIEINNKNDIKIENDDQNYAFPIKEEIDHVTDHNDTGCQDNDTGTNSDNSLYDPNESETYNDERNTDNSPETSHNDPEYIPNDTGSDSEDDHNESETYNDERNTDNSPETSHNDPGYNPNETGPNYNENTTIEGAKNNRVSCKICYKDLSFRSLDVHMSKCHPDLDERKTKCDICSSYITKNRMKRHVALHGDGLLCVYCRKEQNDQETLKIHTESCNRRIKKRTDNNAAKELKACDVCKKVMQKGSIRLHKRLKHAGLGPVCEHCGKKLSNKFRLSEHLSAKHGYEKHKCSLCDFQTAFRVHLKNHERRHRGEKPYICESCGAKYHSQNQLIQHRYTHNANKDYKCDQCPSSFKTTVHLSVHKNTTHSTVPMCCNICTRHFRCKHYLLKHLRNVHRITGAVALDNKI